MNLLDLIVLVCSLTNPTACEEQHILFDAQGGTPRTCALHAPPYMAQWIGEHPGVRIMRWHCDWPDHERQGT